MPMFLWCGMPGEEWAYLRETGLPDNISFADRSIPFSVRLESTIMSSLTGTDCLRIDSMQLFKSARRSLVTMITEIIKGPLGCIVKSRFLQCLIISFFCDEHNLTRVILRG